MGGAYRRRLSRWGHRMEIASSSGEEEKRKRKKKECARVSLLDSYRCAVKISRNGRGREGELECDWYVA